MFDQCDEGYAFRKIYILEWSLHDLMEGFGDFFVVWAVEAGYDKMLQGMANNLHVSNNAFLFILKRTIFSGLSQQFKFYALFHQPVFVPQ